ncbi:19580_t:CDS:2, partial [Racocetra persica]
NLLPKRPVQFQQADNEFEIALIDEENDTTSISTLLHEPTMKQIDQYTKFQLQKKCKVLFLRTRNNNTVLYEEIIIRVCKITKLDKRLGSLTKDIDGWYNLYCHKFHIAVVKLATEFRSINESSIINNTEELLKLDEFVSVKVWKPVLQMHLRATDQAKLRQMPKIFTKLGVFIHQIIKAILIAQDNNKDIQNIIKKCDEYTIDLKISTKLGIVKLLPVQKLLDC